MDSMDKSIMMLKREGKTLPEIGLILRLSRSRLLEQYRKEIQNPEEDRSLTPFAREIRNRTRAALCVHYGGDVLQHPERIATRGVAELTKASRIGAKGRAQIAAALQKTGVIGDAETWLAGGI